MNILFITPYLIYPDARHAGGQDIFQYIKYLSQKHNIYLLSFIEKGEENKVSAVSSYCKLVKTIPAPIIPPQGRLTLGKFSLLFSPNYFVFSRSRLFVRGLNSLLHDVHFDLIQFEYFQTAQYIFHIPFKKYDTILDEHEIASKVLQGQRIGGGWGKLLLKYQIILHKKWEKRVFSRVSKILLRSEADRRYLEGRFGQEISKKLSVLPPLLKDEFLNIREENREKGTILFFGAMDIIYNQEAVLFFMKDIFPMIKKRVKKATFLIVGNNPPEKIRTLGNGVDIIVTGYVQNILDYFSRCEVFVAPIKNPGGILVKILQAFASGRPVIASTDANRGIEAKNGEEIMISDSPKEFSEKVILLMENQNLWRDLSKAGRAFFNRKFTYEKVTSIIDEIYT